MIQENKTKASKMFWLALALYVAAQMLQYLDRPPSDITAGVLPSFVTAIMLFPFGLIYPVSQLLELVVYGRGSGNMTADALSLALLFIASFVLIYGARVYAQGKGYHGAAGYLGILGFAGIAILLMMPDKLKSRAR